LGGGEEVRGGIGAPQLWQNRAIGRFGWPHAEQKRAVGGMAVGAAAGNIPGGKAPGGKAPGVSPIGICGIGGVGPTERRLRARIPSPKMHTIVPTPLPPYRERAEHGEGVKLVFELALELQLEIPTRLGR
jgi:hypothetical protein